MADKPDAAARSGPEDEYDDDRPGDPACWLCRVCPACGTLADADPPTVCPQCRALIPRV
jgi:rubrerythrin